MPRNKQFQISQEKSFKGRSKTARPLDTELVNAVLEKDGKSSPNKQKRTRRFCLTTYIDVQAVHGFLLRSPWVQHFAFCTHDRDYNEDGSPKTLHTHVLLYTYDAKTSSAIKKNFDNFSAEYYGAMGLDPQNTLVQDCNDMGAQFRYLRHLDDSNKAPYGADEVVTDDVCYWNELCKTCGMTDSVNNTGLQIVNDILAGTSTLELVQRYGKEYIYHAKQYKQVICDMSFESSRGKSFAGLRDMCELALAESTFDEAEIRTFLYMLEYVQSEFVNIELNENVERYLKA